MPSSQSWSDNLGARVRATRLERGWSQKELADRSGMSLRFLGQVESGTANVSVARLIELAAALGVSLTALFAGLGPVRDPIDELARHLRTLDLSQQREVVTAFLAPRVRKVALVGLRGAGKSTVGARAADLLHCPFVIVDHEVKRRAGLDLADLFEMRGSEGYLQLCREVLGEMLRSPEPMILEIGGSVVTDPGSWQQLSERARVVWLKAPAEAHLERVAAQGDMRPMEGFEDALVRLRQIMNERAPSYQRAHHAIDTVQLGLDGSVEALVSLARELQVGREDATGGHGGTTSTNP